MVLSKTGLIFAVAGRGHGYDAELIPYHLLSWGRENRFSSEKKGRFLVE